MAKSTKTFSLEGDIVDKIVEYKKINNLSSDSAALERIILEFSYKVNNYNNNKLDNIEGLVTELLTRIDTKNSKDIKADIELKDVILPWENDEILKIDSHIEDVRNQILNLDVTKVKYNIDDDDILTR